MSRKALWSLMLLGLWEGQISEGNEIESAPYWTLGVMRNFKGDCREQEVKGLACTNATQPANGLTCAEEIAKLPKTCYFDFALTYDFYQSFGSRNNQTLISPAWSMTRTIWSVKQTDIAFYANLIQGGSLEDRRRALEPESQTAFSRTEWKEAAKIGCNPTFPTDKLKPVEEGDDFILRVRGNDPVPRLHPYNNTFEVIMNDPRRCTMFTHLVASVTTTVAASGGGGEHELKDKGWRPVRYAKPRLEQLAMKRRVEIEKLKIASAPYWTLGVMRKFSGACTGNEEKLNACTSATQPSDGETCAKVIQSLPPTCDFEFALTYEFLTPFGSQDTQTLISPAWAMTGTNWSVKHTDIAFYANLLQGRRRATEPESQTPFSRADWDAAGVQHRCYISYPPLKLKVLPGGDLILRVRGVDPVSREDPDRNTFQVKMDDPSRCTMFTHLVASVTTTVAARGGGYLQDFNIAGWRPVPVRFVIAEKPLIEQWGRITKLGNHCEGVTGPLDCNQDPLHANPWKCEREIARLSPGCEYDYLYKQSHFKNLSDVQEFILTPGERSEHFKSLDIAFYNDKNHKLLSAQVSTVKECEFEYPTDRLRLAEGSSYTLQYKGSGGETDAIPFRVKYKDSDKSKCPLLQVAKVVMRARYSGAVPTKKTDSLVASIANAVSKASEANGVGVQGVPPPSPTERPQEEKGPQKGPGGENHIHGDDTTKNGPEGPKRGGSSKDNTASGTPENPLSNQAPEGHKDGKDTITSGTSKDQVPSQDPVDHKDGKGTPAHSAPIGPGMAKDPEEPSPTATSVAASKSSNTMSGLTLVSLVLAMTYLVYHA